MRARYRLRQVVNAVNLSTLLGLTLARIEHAALERGHAGLVVARGARGRFPAAAAYTVGNVVIVRTPHPSDELLEHEARHATQWACCVVLFLPLYLLAMLWSYAACGDHWSRNTFERRAGLAAGGYEQRQTRWRHQRGQTH